MSNPHGGPTSYDHKCRISGMAYQLSWRADVIAPIDKRPYPRAYSKMVPEASARVFCQKWQVTFPGVK